jgi:hypothetical protein
VKVRLKQQMSGLRHGTAWPAVNEVLEVDDAEGAQLCQLGIAEPVVEDRTETATPPEPEKRGPGRPRKDA